MDPLHFCIMVAPLGVYFFLIGIVNLLPSPFVTRGARDLAALGIAISGLVVAGPLELFFPESAAGRFGPYVWLLLIAFYGLCVSLAVLLMRPRIVIYNMSPQGLRPILGDLAIRLDRKARWVGNSLHLPTLDVQLHLEGNSWFNQSQLISIGDRQRFESWREIEKELKAQLNAIKSRNVLVGFALITSAVLLASASIVWVLNQPDSVRQSLADMLRI